MLWTGLTKRNWVEKYHGKILDLFDSQQGIWFDENDLSKIRICFWGYTIGIFLLRYGDCNQIKKLSKSK